VAPWRFENIRSFENNLGQEKRNEDVSAKDGEIARRWVLVDAAGQNLGRMSTRVAMILRGKNKPTFAPHADVGDFVVVINAEKVAFTGKKALQKMYYHHSQYPGGLREDNMAKVLKERPSALWKRPCGACSPRPSWGRPSMAS